MPVSFYDGVTTITLSPVYPVAAPKTLNQFVGISDDNTVRVAVIGDGLVTFPLSFRQLSRTQKEAIEAFFLGLDYSDEFVYTDLAGSTHTVRLLDPNFTLPEVFDDNVQFDCVLTKVG